MPDIYNEKGVSVRPVRAVECDCDTPVHVSHFEETDEDDSEALWGVYVEDEEGLPTHWADFAQRLNALDYADFLVSKIPPDEYVKEGVRYIVEDGEDRPVGVACENCGSDQIAEEDKAVRWNRVGYITEGRPAPGLDAGIIVHMTDGGGPDWETVRAFCENCGADYPYLDFQHFADIVY